MPLDVYFPHTIERIIRGVTTAQLSAAQAHGNGNVEYCRGVLDNARALAVAFGVPWDTMAVEIVRQLETEKGVT